MTHHRNGVGANPVGETGVDGGLSGNVARADLLDYCASDDVVNIFLIHGCFVHETLEG